MLLRMGLIQKSRFLSLSHASGHGVVVLPLHDAVLVNNRAEGNAPLTVQALTEMLRS